MFYDKNCYYDGNWEKNKKDGFGTYNFGEGRLYYGQWK